MTNITTKQKITYAIVALDAAGNVVTTVPVDAPPAWTNSNNAAATLVVAADSGSAELTPVDPNGGADQVGVSVSIGGQVFTATDDVTITPAAQQVSSIKLVATVSQLP